jgi:hypothetical protein
VIAQFGTTFRLSLIEQKHNRFAIALLLCYLPAWYGIIAALSAGTIQFKLRAFGVIVITSQERLGLLTGMLNATTLIMGFVGLTVMRQSEAVDQRLVLCGHSRAALVLGRLLALGLASLAVAAYATGVLALFFPPRHFALVGRSGRPLLHHHAEHRRHVHAKPDRQRGREPSGGRILSVLPADADGRRGGADESRGVVAVLGGVGMGGGLWRAGAGRVLVPDPNGARLRVTGGSSLRRRSPA